MAAINEIKILVVDDEEDMRDIISFDLKRKGFVCFVASDGREAIQILEKNKIELVISDIRMPGMNGIQMLEEIRRVNPVMPKVFFLTGFSDISADDCLKKGAQEVFSKPFDKHTLFDAIRRHLSIQF